MDDCLQAAVEYKDELAAMPFDEEVMDGIGMVVRRRRRRRVETSVCHTPQHCHT
jgi:hypothetical protein